MDTREDAPEPPHADPEEAAAASRTAPAVDRGSAGEEAAPPRSDPRRSPSPPGTILAAGTLIGLAIGELAFLVLVRPGRFLPPHPWVRMGGFYWLTDIFTLAAELAMLVCGFGLLLHGRRWAPGALVVVVARGLVAFLGTALGKMMLGGSSGPELLDMPETHAELSFLAWETLIPFVLLFGVWWALRRRAGRPVAMAPWRRLHMIAEGLAACAFVGLMTYMAAVVPRSMVGLYEAEAPRDAARASHVAGIDLKREGVPPDDAQGGGLLPDIDPALFRNHLDAVGGGSRPVWEPGPSATLVDFWASWCPPCLAELPDLQALQERLAGRGVKVVVVNVDLGDPVRTAKFLERKGIRLGGLVDRDGVLFQALGLQALPSTFVLDAKGRPVRFFEGALSPQELETALLHAGDARVRRSYQ